MGKIYEDNSLSIGNTPLIKLNRISTGLSATILVKIEGAIRPIQSSAGLGRL